MCRLRGVKLILIPHALDRMNQCSVSEEQVRHTVENPDAKTVGRLSRTVAEKRFEDEKGDRYVRVVYNQEDEGEVVVVTVFTHRRRSQEVSR
ncbi:hypothetical protein BH23ACT11_BH23ACT11_30480 [soil metagenome]